MILNTEPIKNWFGYTRRERRSASVLLLLIVVIFGLRYTIPEKKIVIEEIAAVSREVMYHSEPSGKDSLLKTVRFPAEQEAITKSGQPRQKRKSIAKYSLIDINSSDSATLVRLPGIGPVLSARIIKYRHLLGGYAGIEQLKEVYGLPEETFELIRERIYADSSVITRININKAPYKELLRFPYFEKYEVSAILKFRELKGRITGINDLTDNKLITMEKAIKVRPYLKFGQ